MYLPKPTAELGFVGAGSVGDTVQVVISSLYQKMPDEDAIVVERMDVYAGIAVWLCHMAICG
jgi:hypothetical protein